MTEQERRALFFKATGMLYCHSPMWVYQAFCKGIEYEREACAKVADAKKEHPASSFLEKYCASIIADGIRARGAS